MQSLKRFPVLIYLFLRILLEIYQVLRFFYHHRRKHFEKVLIQNPPCFHILPVVFFIKYILKCKIFVDIHNFGYTLFSSKHQILRKIMHFFEIFWIRLVADKIYVVSKIMREELISKWRVSDVTVLYDRPNKKKFKKLSLLEKHNFYF